MLCPHCHIDINDPAPECPKCGFHIRDLDADFGPPPAHPGSLLDEAGLLDPDERKRLGARLEAFQDETDCQFIVVTQDTTAPRLPSEFVFWLFNRWEVGGKEGRGLLLLLARDERRIEVEVGIGLEEIVTDQASQRILDAHSVPFLKAGRFAEGLTWAVDILARLVEHATEETRK